MSIKYRIYCITEDGWQEQYADSSLTECPNDALHSINIDSVQELDVSAIMIRLPIYQSVNLSNYKRIGRVQYDPTSQTIRIARALCYISGGMTSVDIQINDTTSNTEMLNINLTNTEEEIILDLGSLSNVPVSKSILEINVKCNGISSNTNAYISEVLFYS